jgi:hypothetical protein
LSFFLRSADGILDKCPAELDRFTTLALFFRIGNRVSQTLNVEK